MNKSILTLEIRPIDPEFDSGDLSTVLEYVSANQESMSELMDGSMRLEVPGYAYRTTTRPVPPLATVHLEQKYENE